MSAAGRTALLLVLAALAAAAPPAFSGSPEVAESLLARRAPVAVVVRFVMKLEGSFNGQSFDRESKGESYGVVVDPAGLVLVATQSHVARAVARQTPGASLRIVPSHLRVVFGDDLDKEYECVLVASDDSLGFTYLQVVDLGARKPAFVDLSKGAAPMLGATVYAASRMSRGFDYAPVLLRARVSERVEQPRPMWGLTGDASFQGLVLYDATGAPVGVTAIQYTSEQDLVDPSSLSANTRAFLLPLDAVRASVTQTLRRVPEALAAAKAAKEAPDEPAPAAPAPAPGKDVPAPPK